METLAAVDNAETRMRIVLSRGVGRSGDLDPASASNPSVVIIAQPLNPPSPAMYEEGVGAEVVSVTRNHPSALDPSVKSGNYLNNVMAIGEARSRRPGVHEAILCSADGFVAEGATSNVFAVQDGILKTPGLDIGILDGITRAKVLTIAKDLQLSVQETSFTPDALTEATEIFLTSAARGVLPVTTLNGKPVGDGRPGPVTRLIRDTYFEVIAREAALEAALEAAAEAPEKAAKNETNVDKAAD
jgi:branched-chain amino acid aminotransferase